MSSSHFRYGGTFFYIFLTFLSILYLFMLYPSVSWLDTGELIASSVMLTIPHPPGEPLFPLIGKFFTFLPFGNIGFKLNMLSAVSGLLSFILFFRLVTTGLEEVAGRGSIPDIIPLLSPLPFINFAMVKQVVRAEVYTPLLLLILLSIHFSLKGAGRRKNRLLSAFFYGLAFGLHPLISISLFPLILYISILLWKVSSKRELFTLLLTFSCSFLLYLYLPIRASRDIFFNWGEPDSFASFFDVVLSRNFFQNFSPFDLEMMSHNLRETLTGLLNWFGIPGILLICSGFIGLKNRKERFIVAGLIICILSNLFSLLVQNKVFRTNPDLMGYLSTSILAYYLLIGFGFKNLLELPVLKSLKSKKTVLKLLHLSLFLLLFLPFPLQFHFLNENDNYLAEGFVQSMLSRLPTDSLIMTSGNNSMFIHRYLDVVEGLRGDVTVLYRQMLTHKWYRETLKRRYEELGDSLKSLKGKWEIHPFLLSVSSKRRVFIEFRSEDLPLLHFSSFHPPLIEIMKTQPTNEREEVGKELFRKRMSEVLPDPSTIMRDGDALLVYLYQAEELRVFFREKGDRELENEFSAWIELIKSINAHKRDDH